MITINHNKIIYNNIIIKNNMPGLKKGVGAGLQLGAELEGTPTYCRFEPQRTGGFGAPSAPRNAQGGVLGLGVGGSVPKPGPTFPGFFCGPVNLRCLVERAVNVRNRGIPPRKTPSTSPLL